MRNFRDWTLAELDRAFNLTVLNTSPVLEDWLNSPAEISSFEQQALDYKRCSAKVTLPAAK